jgi:hypothetical protein
MFVLAFPLRRRSSLAVSFRQVVHPVLTEEAEVAEVAEASDPEGEPDEHA